MSAADRMRVGESLYAAAMHLARPLATLAAPASSKLRRGVAGRRGAVAALAGWAGRHRDPDRPLIWLHAPSVGEGLMAHAIARALREALPDVQIAHTFFSPSAETWADRLEADVVGYLPWDVRAAVRPALSALRPAAIVFVRTEIWPVLTLEARSAGVRLALVNAVLPPGSSRLRPLSRLVLGPAHARLDAVGAVAEADARRFTRLGVPRERIRVTGDARFDQVWSRVAALTEGRPTDATAPFLDRLRDAGYRTLVAGSTWPPDERRLVPAFGAAREAANERLRLIIAPHEPDERHLSSLENELARAGLASARLERIMAGEQPPPEVVLVDRVGVLADLYSVADVAYVGGGFHSAGLHSVVEPAALGLPVIFGPRHGNAREAAELEVAGGGFSAASSAELEELIGSLMRDRIAARTTGRSAADYVRSRLGGAERNAALVLELLSREPG